MPDSVSSAWKTMPAAPMRLVVNSSTDHDRPTGAVSSTRNCTVVFAPMLPTLSTARSVRSWTPSSRVKVTLSALVDVQALVPSAYCTLATPEPWPSVAAVLRPLTVTVVDCCHADPSPTVTVPTVGPVRSIPTNIVVVAESPERAYTVSRDDHVPSLMLPLLQSHP